MASIRLDSCQVNSNLLHLFTCFQKQSIVTEYFLHTLVERFLNNFVLVIDPCLFMVFYYTLGDPVEFLSWFLNTLHLALCAKDKKSSIVHDTFRGEMKIYSRKLPPPTDV